MQITPTLTAHHNVSNKPLTSFQGNKLRSDSVQFSAITKPLHERLISKILYKDYDRDVRNKLKKESPIDEITYSEKFHTKTVLHGVLEKASEATYSRFRLSRFKVLTNYINDLNVQDSQRRTPLMLACQLKSDRLQIVEEMLRLGAKPNMMTEDQKTPLHYLLSCPVVASDSRGDKAPKDDIAIFKLLLQQGASFSPADIRFAIEAERDDLIPPLLEHMRNNGLTLPDKFSSGSSMDDTLDKIKDPVKQTSITNAIQNFNRLDARQDKFKSLSDDELAVLAKRIKRQQLENQVREDSASLTDEQLTELMKDLDPIL